MSVAATATAQSVAQGLGSSATLPGFLVLLMAGVEGRQLCLARTPLSSTERTSLTPLPMRHFAIAPHSVLRLAEGESKVQGHLQHVTCSAPPAFQTRTML